MAPPRARDTTDEWCTDPVVVALMIPAVAADTSTRSRPASPTTWWAMSASPFCTQRVSGDTTK
jgi:hypothetical protein